MAKTAISGTITRIVDPEGPNPRVFFRPSDPSVLRKLDGSQYLASGEISAPAPDGVEDLKVGDPFSAEI